MVYTISWNIFVYIFGHVFPSYYYFINIDSIHTCLLMRSDHRYEESG